jgi:hypothetical protein
MRPKEWERSQSESVRKYRSPQKFLALKRSSLHFPLRRCGSRRLHFAPMRSAQNVQIIIRVGVAVKIVGVGIVEGHIDD